MVLPESERSESYGRMSQYREELRREAVAARTRMMMALGAFAPTTAENVAAWERILSVFDEVAVKAYGVSGAPQS
jgi:hypothetical protein